MAINHVVIEGRLATKPQMADPETVEFLLQHFGARGKLFGLFHVEAWSGVPDLSFLQAKEGDPVVVCGVLVEGYVLEEGKSRRLVKIRALRLSRLHLERPQPPEAFNDPLLEDAVPF